MDRSRVATVLEAWSVLHPEVRYTQGLNEVTAILLVRNRGDQSRAMAELQRLAAPEALGGLWFSGMPLFFAGKQQLQALAAAVIPELQERLDVEGLDISAYLPQAWHSLFAKWLPSELAVAAVDDLLEHGMTAVLAITIVILKEVEGDMLQALDQPGAEAMEVLLGESGFFSRLRELLGRCGPSLQARWQELQRSPVVVEAAASACEASSGDEVGVSRTISGSLVGLVQQEAVLRLATSASRRHDERLSNVVHNVNIAQEKAIRDELLGNHHCLFKFAVIGDTAVGKSCLIHRGTSGSFDASGSPTSGVDFASTSLRICRQRVKIQIWDLPGMTSFIHVTRSYLRDISLVLLVYDICCRESFEGIVEWMDEIRKTSQNPDIVIVLVGNKLDVPQHRQVSAEEARSFAMKHPGMLSVECSALRGDNVDALFLKAGEAVHGLVESSNGRELPGVKFRNGTNSGGRLNGCRRAASNCLVL